MKISVIMPDPDRLAANQRKLFQRQGVDVFLEQVTAERDEFWRGMSKEALRAPNRTDKRRLMRWTGTTARSYIPRESSRGARNPFAEIYSDYLVAVFHEQEPRRVTIRPVKKKMLSWVDPFTGERRFARQVTIMRRQPMKWTLRRKEQQIRRKGRRAYAMAINQSIRTLPLPPDRRFPPS